MNNSVAQEGLELKFAGSLVEQLGAQQYPSATAAVAELISNAWDADAANVWVTVPFGDGWAPENSIVVTDDGSGMDYESAGNAYLVVGRKRRVVEKSATTPGGRALHGRKGIGKLAAFGTAGVLECVSVRVDAEPVSFRLEYDEIRKLPPDIPYPVQQVEDDSPPSHPDSGDPLEHGTRITMTSLSLKRAISEKAFVESMSRRFAIAQDEMKVFINGKPLERFHVTTQFRFPQDGIPNREIEIDDDGWAREELEDGKEVRWWIGFTKKPVDDESLLGISVLASQKMAQRPFKFERSQGVEGQLGQEYMIGEVRADWIDEGLDIEDDLIQSNRDQLQLEDERLETFLEWGRKLVNWALRERNKLRKAAVVKVIEDDPDIEDLLADFTPAEKKPLREVAAAISQIPEIEPGDVTELMAAVVDARSDVVVRELMEEIASDDEPFQERFWELVNKFGLIDARRNQSIIEARLKAIEKLKSAVHDGAKEVPDLHTMVLRDPWLLDPRWVLAGDEIDVETLGVDFTPEADDETGLQLDFLFVLQPKPPAPLDDVIVVEIKRGASSDGNPRKASDVEVNKFHSYVLAIVDHYATNSNPPRVRGIMVAQGYTAKGDKVRKSLSTLPHPPLEFKTWDMAIDETERMHLGWLELSRARANISEGIDLPESAEQAQIEVVESPSGEQPA